MNPILESDVKNLPSNPGIYKFYDLENQILYIGKAKNLKKRVASYFSKVHDGKTRVLVKKIVSVEYTIVETEMDALLLENSLIKEFQPRYNILLKDDKTYPYLKIVNERFPRVITTRNKIKDGSKYLGPYSSVVTQKILLEFLHNTFPLRTCKYNLSEKNIENSKFKACLEYHLGKCNAPCEGKEDEITYNNYVESSKKILSGKASLVKKFMKDEMNNYSSEMKFEEAEKIKYKIDLIDNYQSKSTIVSTNLNDIDVFTISSKENISVVNYLKIGNGTILSTKSISIKNNIDDTDEEILTHSIIRLRNDSESDNKEIITNLKITIPSEDIKISLPSIGDRFKLLKLSQKNSESVLNDLIKNKVEVSRKISGITILEQAKKDLHLKEIPFHIECFDNSNIQGTTPVASMVCFKNSIPSKKDYRHYNIKTVEGPDDFASMYEIVYRRYKRLIEEKLSLPQLIVIDGGKGQLGKAVEALTELNLISKVTVISIAKRLEEIFYPGDSFPLYLNKKSTTLKLIQRLRDEAHRFAITFHRLKRDKVSKTEIDMIKGIGEETVKVLYSELRTISNIKNNPQEVERLIGKTKAELIQNYFNIKRA